MEGDGQDGFGVASLMATGKGRYFDDGEGTVDSGKQGESKFVKVGKWKDNLEPIYRAGDGE